MKIINPLKRISKINIKSNFPLIENIINDLESFFNKNEEKKMLKKINELINLSYKLNEKDLKIYIDFLLKENSHLLIIELLRKNKKIKIIEKVLELLIIMTTEETKLFIDNGILVFLNFLLKSEDSLILGNVFWVLGNIIVDEPDLKNTYNDLFIFEDSCKIILQVFENDDVLGGFIVFSKNYLLTEKMNYRIDYKNDLFDIFMDFFLEDNKKNYDFYLLDILEIFNFFFEQKNNNIVFPDFSKNEGSLFLKKIVNLLITPKENKSQKNIIKFTCLILKKIYLNIPHIEEKLIETPIFKFLNQNIKSENFEIFKESLKLLNYLIEKKKPTNNIKNNFI